MAKDMKQAKTDYGTRGETGEKLPKKATSSDMSGERKEGIKNGVGLGQADKVGVMYGEGRPASHMGKHDGRLGEFNDGKTEGDCYSHKRVAHEQDK